MLEVFVKSNIKTRRERSGECVCRVFSFWLVTKLAADLPSLVKTHHPDYYEGSCKNLTCQIAHELDSIEDQNSVRLHSLF